MTVNDFANEMAREFGEQYTDPDVKQQILAWVQEVFSDVYQAAPWSFRNETIQVSLTAGVATATITDGVTVKGCYIHSAADSSLVGRSIVYVPVERILARPGVNIVSDTGTPTAWFYEDHDPATHLLTLRFHPTPDANLTLKLPALKNPPVLAETEQIPLSEDFFPALREGVRARVRYNDDNVQASQASYAMMEKMLQRLANGQVGPMGAPSNLRVKRSKAIHQAPTAQGAGA